MLHIARSAVGILIGGIVFGTVLCGHAMAVERKATAERCVPLEVGVAILHKLPPSTLAAVGPSDMPKLIETMKGLGKTVSGDAAVIVHTGPSKFVIFVKRGDQLCRAAEIGVSTSDAPASLDRANKPNKLGEIFA